MTPSQMIRKSVVDKCNASNCDPQVTNQVADQTVKMFESNNFANPSKLVDEAVTRAKSLSKKGRR